MLNEWPLNIGLADGSSFRIIEWRGKPVTIRGDNGSEYISEILTSWAQQNDIKIEYIQPGNPQQNAYIGRYNRTVQHEWRHWKVSPKY